MLAVALFCPSANDTPPTRKRCSANSTIGRIDLGCGVSIWVIWPQLDGGAPGGVLWSHSPITVTSIVSVRVVPHSSVAVNTNVYTVVPAGAATLGDRVSNLRPG